MKFLTTGGVLLTLLMGNVSSCFAQGELLDNVADFIEGFFHKEELAEEELIMAAPAQQPVNVKELQSREDRLREFLYAYSSWIDHYCQLTEPQHQELAALVDAAILQAQAKHKRSNHQNDYLFDHTPVVFIDKNGAAHEVLNTNLNQDIEKLLDEEQRDKLDTAREERAQRLHEIFLERIVHTVDQELYLSTAQRDQLIGFLNEKKQRLDNALYVFHNQTYYIKYARMELLLKQVPNNFLTDSQQIRLDDLQNQANRSMTFMTADGKEAWYKQLNEAVESSRELFQHAADVRVDYYAQEYNLPEEDQKYLQLAGKGVACTSVANWRKKSVEQLKNWEQHIAPGQNFGFGLSQIQVDQIDEHELWKHACARVTADKTATEKTQLKRDELSRESRIRYVTALLDQELWFTPDQFDAVAALLDQKYPDGTVHTNDYLREIELVAFPILRFKNDEINALLGDVQQQTWKQLKGIFRLEGGNARMNYRHGEIYLNVPNARTVAKK